jgi:hypothetical protein
MDSNIVKQVFLLIFRSAWKGNRFAFSIKLQYFLLSMLSYNNNSCLLLIAIQMIAQNTEEIFGITSLFVIYIFCYIYMQPHKQFNLILLIINFD